MSKISLAAAPHQIHYSRRRLGDRWSCAQLRRRPNALAGIGIGPKADAIALVFPEHAEIRRIRTVGADCFGGERVKAVAFLQSVRLLNRQLSLLVSNDVAYWHFPDLDRCPS
jgi:hypothetical protein